MLRFFRWLFSAAPFDCLVAANEGVRFHNEPTCEQCKYSLNGLAADGKCPECGTAYDAASRFRKLRRPIWGRGVLAVPLVLAFALFAIAVYLPGLNDSIRLLTALAGLLCVFVGNGIAVGWFIRWIVIQARTRERRYEVRSASIRSAQWPLC